MCTFDIVETEYYPSRWPGDNVSTWCVYVFVCGDVYPDDLTMKDWC